MSILRKYFLKIKVFFLKRSPKRFDYRKREFDQDYMFHFWRYLYFSNERVMADEVRRKNRGWRRIKKWIPFLYFKKIYFLNSNFSFRTRGVLLEEVNRVKESLMKFPLSELEELDLFLDMIPSEDFIVASFRILKSILKRVGFVLFSIIVPYNFLEGTIKEIIDNQEKQGKIIATGIMNIICIFYLICIYKALESSFSTRDKRKQVATILPKLIKEVIKTKKDNNIID